MAVYRCRTLGLGDQCAEGFDLPLNGVRGRIAALAAATAVVVDDAEPLRQLLGQSLSRVPIAEDAAHHDDGWAFAEAVEGDPSPVR
jgi:hypothetical protein